MHIKYTNDLIHPGSLVSVRLCNKQTWNLNIAYRCDDCYIDLPLTPEFVNSLVLVNSSLVIKYNDDDYEYLMNGVVTGVELSELPFFRVKVFNAFRIDNNREFPRNDVYLPASLSFSGNCSVFCIISNLSLGGFSFIANQDMPQSDECEINICLNEGSSVSGKGKIVRRTNFSFFQECSMQFTYMDEYNSNALSSGIYSINKSYDLLRKKYLGI